MELSDLRIKIFADGADLTTMVKLSENPLVKGFTTNPTLMRKAGISDYAGFAQEVLRLIIDRPISFEVFSDEFDEMERQAHIINSWADNVYVKIPVTNTRAHTAGVLAKWTVAFTPPPASEHEQPASETSSSRVSRRKLHGVSPRARRRRKPDRRPRGLLR